MRSRYLEVPRPKNGSTYRGIAVCRISKETQDEMSLADQEALYREQLPDYLDGPYYLEVMATQGSGEILERAEFIDLSEKIVNGTYDFVICEDLGRIARRIQVMILCESAEDSATRIIAINDRVDTLDEGGWKQNAFFATIRHESYNRDTSQRIRRSLRNRFANGEMVTHLMPGQIKPRPGASEAECYKDPAAQPIYDEWFDRLERGQTFRTIADWLNSIGFPTSTAARKSSWDGTLVRYVTYNPLLKGLRIRNRKIAKRINKTGRRKSVVAPAEMLLIREVPHLTFIHPERYDRVVRMRQKANEKYAKGRERARCEQPKGTRNDSRWPSQHLRCGICGRLYVLGGHGRKERMMCDGARGYKCWNSMTVDQCELARAVSTDVRHQLQSLPDFDSELIKQIRIESQELARSQNRELDRLETERKSVRQEIDRLTEAIASLTLSQALLIRLSTAEQRLRDLDSQVQELAAARPVTPEIPTANEIRQLAQQAFLDLAIDSREYAEIMRCLLRDFYILPYRLIDGGNILPRVVFKFDLGQIDGVEMPDKLESTTLDCMVDLTVQPQRVVFREQVVALRAKGMKERDIAAQLGITQPAVQCAAKLQRDMIRVGVNDPWQPVTSHTEAQDYFKRILHPRFHFEPVDNFTPKFPVANV